MYGLTCGVEVEEGRLHVKHFYCQMETSGQNECTLLISAALSCPVFKNIHTQTHTRTDTDTHTHTHRHRHTHTLTHSLYQTALGKACPRSSRYLEFLDSAGEKEGVLSHLFSHHTFYTHLYSEGDP